MNRILVCMLLVAVAALVSGQLVNTDPKTIKAVLNNPDAVKAQANCITATEERAKIICDKTGKSIRDRLPEIIRTGTCPPPCTDTDKSWMAFVLKTLREKYADLLKQILTHLKITPEQEKKMDEFLASTPLPAGV